MCLRVSIAGSSPQVLRHPIPGVKTVSHARRAKSPLSKNLLEGLRAPAKKIEPWNLGAFRSTGQRGWALSLDLIEVTVKDIDSHQILYRWDREEPHREQYTCRPVSTLPAWDIFMESVLHRVGERALRVFVLWDMTLREPLGRVTVFDHNPRNHSAEFGYYLPPMHRQRGYGRAMVQQFLTVMFADAEWSLNKLYATTASGNVASIRLLEGARVSLRWDHAGALLVRG